METATISIEEYNRLRDNDKILSKMLNDATGVVVNYNYNSRLYYFLTYDEAIKSLVSQHATKDDIIDRFIKINGELVEKSMEAKHTNRKANKSKLIRWLKGFGAMLIPAIILFACQKPAPSVQCYRCTVRVQHAERTFDTCSTVLPAGDCHLLPSYQTQGPL